MIKIRPKFTPVVKSPVQRSVEPVAVANQPRPMFIPDKVKPMGRVMDEVPTVNRAMTVSTAVSPIGCCNFFPPCSDGIMSLHYNGKLDLMDWIGFQPTDVCLKRFGCMILRTGPLRP